MLFCNLTMDAEIIDLMIKELSERKTNSTGNKNIQVTATVPGYCPTSAATLLLRLTNYMKKWRNSMRKICMRTTSLHAVHASFMFRLCNILEILTLHPVRRHAGTTRHQCHVSFCLARREISNCWLKAYK